VGRVLAAAVYHFVGKAKGLVHQIWVDRRPVSPGRGGFLHGDDVLGNVTPDMRQGVRNTFFAVREYVRSRFPHRTGDILDYDYTYKVTKEDEPSGGLSAGLPTALGFLSVFLQAPVPQDLASTGVVIADAHDVLLVRHVAEIEFKVKAAYNRNLRRLLLPRDNRAEVEANPTLPRTATAELVHYVATLDEAVSVVWGADIWTQ
jgi:ATP-dependent Lon protease